jgi:uncharacterized membrane protein YuzA (DUF378 family)
MRTLKVVTFALVVVGALNWGLVGLARFDLVAAIFGLEFGETSRLTAAVYLLVGASALFQAATFTPAGGHSPSVPVATR